MADDLLIPIYYIAGQAESQSPSSLLSLVSNNVRLLIYEATLTDSGRLLHIVSYRGKQRQKGIGHWHCEDKESPFPIWQHSCFCIQQSRRKRSTALNSV
jgi:hypothetical protein